MVIPYDQSLDRPLEGPVNMIREERGQFTLRHDPFHVRATIHARADRMDHRYRVQKVLDEEREAREQEFLRTS